MLSHHGTRTGAAPRPQACRLVLARACPARPSSARGINTLDDAPAVEALIDAFYRPLLDQGLEAARAAFHARGLSKEPSRKARGLMGGLATKLRGSIAPSRHAPRRPRRRRRRRSPARPPSSRRCRRRRWCWTRENRFRFANPAAEQFFGLSAPSLAALRLPTCCPEDGRLFALLTQVRSHERAGLRPRPRAGKPAASAPRRGLGPRRAASGDCRAAWCSRCRTAPRRGCSAGSWTSSAPRAAPRPWRRCWRTR